MNAPKVHQHIGNLELTVLQQQTISPQTNSKKTISEGGQSKASYASSKARKLAAMQSEIAAAELKLLQAKLREEELASEGRGSIVGSLNVELEQTSLDANEQEHDGAWVSPSKDQVVSTSWYHKS